MMLTVGKRLRERVRELGLSDAEVARRCGLSPRRLGNYLNDVREPDFQTLQKILDTLDMTPNQAFGADFIVHDRAGTPTAVIEAKTPDQPPAYTGALAPGLLPVAGQDYASIPRFDARLSAGPGSLLEAEPEPLGYYLVEAQWLRAITRARPETLAVVMVDGDSMEPTLWNRDWVLLDTTQQRIQRQGVFALRFHDTVWVKRLQPSLSRQTIRILSDNDHYEPDEASEDNLSVIGRVVALLARPLA